jgi:hypothetical protein
VREQPYPFAVAGTGKKNDQRRFHSLTSELWPNGRHNNTDENDSPRHHPYTHGSREPIPPMAPNGSGNDGSNHGNDAEMIPPVPTPRGLGSGNHFALDHVDGDLAALAAVQNILALAPGDLAAYRAELAGVPDDDPHIAIEREALARADAIRAAKGAA